MSNKSDSDTLENLFTKYTAPEELSGYKLEGCLCPNGVSVGGSPAKRLSIYSAPPVLAIALKRSTFGFRAKNNRRIRFPLKLSLDPFMSDDSRDVWTIHPHDKDKQEGSGRRRRRQSVLYSLYAMVQHENAYNSAAFGHFLCTVRSVDARWYAVDDHRVANIEESDVLGKNPFMLFYLKDNVAQHDDSSMGSDDEWEKEPTQDG